MKINLPRIQFIILIIFLVFVNVSHAQDYASISGKVYDTITRKPIVSANVYIANTFLGTSTDKSGYFRIDKIPLGKYEVIVSHISYEADITKFIINKKNNYDHTIELIPKAILLPEISVTDQESDEWRDNFEDFREGIIGYGENAEKTKILNPYYINFSENDEGSLVASCDVPIEIENRALGYHILYFLKHFEKSFNSVMFAGFPVFDTLKASSEEERKYWEENRVKAYCGSLRHFLAALSKTYEEIQSGKNEVSLELNVNDITDNGISYNYSDDQELVKQGFECFITTTLPWETKMKQMLIPLHPDSILSKGKKPSELILNTKGNYIEVHYLREQDDKRYLNTFNKSFQYSWLELKADSVKIDKKGRYFDEYMINTYGYLGLERLSDLVPFEYEVPDSVLYKVKLY